MFDKKYMELVFNATLLQTVFIFDYQSRCQCRHADADMLIEICEISRLGCDVIISLLGCDVL